MIRRRAETAYPVGTVLAFVRFAEDLLAVPESERLPMQRCEQRELRRRTGRRVRRVVR